MLPLAPLWIRQCQGKEILGDDIGHFLVMEKGCIFSCHFPMYGFIDNTKKLPWICQTKSSQPQFNSTIGKYQAKDV